MDKTTEAMIAKAYDDGVKDGIRQMTDHILHQFEIGKPVEIRGDLYWLKDARQNLIDIMDDIESAWNEENRVTREKKYIVTITRTKDLCTTSNDVIVKAPTPHHAMLWAIDEFACDGWEIDKNYQNYKELE